jgi:response regulator NasT
MTQPPDTTDSTAADPSIEQMARRTTIVIAEDEALIRLDLKETLIEEGYDVIGEAGDGAEAMRLVEDLGPDVAILDIKMPVTDGLTAAGSIIDRRLAAVVILTAFSQRDLIEQARDAGALAYVVKPFHRNELIPAIELARARFSELTDAHERVESLERQLETRKLVDRAKGHLMDVHALTEQEAFRFVQTSAMGSRATMREVAERVLDGSLAP